jgi:gamma-D-glutamyl-L-lysine dipeptidyl-peptidase
MINAQNFIDELQEKLSIDKRFSIFNYSIRKEEKNITINLKISNKNLKKVIKDLFSFYFIDVNNPPELKIEILPLERFKEKPFGIANSGFIPMYKNPTNTSEMINQILFGEICSLLDISDDNEWILIKLEEDGYLGWVNIRSIHPYSEKEMRKRMKMRFIRIINIKAEILELPDESSDPIRSAYLGIKLPVIKKTGDWFRILMPDESFGWVNKRDVEVYKTIKPKNARKILKTSKMFLGTSYLWGGRSVDGIDCSGFVKAVFNFNGYEVPRDSGLQIRIGKDLGKDFKDYLPGDLLFFGPNEKKTTHVAIYTGEGMSFIHSSGYVRYNSLDKNHKLYDERLYNLFKGARRIINSL